MHCSGSPTVDTLTRATAAVVLEIPNGQDVRHERDLWLLVRPLKAVYDGKMSSASGPNHVMSFKRLQHWAVRVGEDFVYEVVRTPDGHAWRQVTNRRWDQYNEDLLRGATERHLAKKDKFGYRVRKMWHDPVGGDPVHSIRLIGQTKLSDSELYRTAEAIWNFMGEYRAFSTNCQSFAQLFWSFTDNSQEAPPGKVFNDFPAAFNPRFFKHTVNQLVKLHLPEKNRQKLVGIIRNYESSQKLVSDTSEVQWVVKKAEEERRKMRCEGRILKDSAKKKKEAYIGG